LAKKSLLDFIFLGLFIMCIALAMSAALEYMTVATERPYLLQGSILLIAVAATVGLVFLMRALGAVARKLRRGHKTLIECGCLVIIFAAGLIARLLVIWAIDLQPESDFETYYMLGSLLSRGELLEREGELYREYVAKFPHTIGFPMFVLQPAFNTFGESVRTALYANLAISMGTVLLANRAGRAMGGRLCGLLVAGLAALWPSHVLYSSMVASEPAFTFLIVLAMLLAATILKRGSTTIRERHPILVVVLVPILGIVLGLSNAIRPMALILLASMCFVFLIQPDERLSMGFSAARHILSRGWLCMGLILLCYFITSNIITQNVSEKVQLEPAGGLVASGYNMMVGANVEHRGVWNQDDADFFNGVYDETGSAEEAHLASMSAALERISANPENTLNLYIFKFRDLWQSDDFGIDWNLLWLGQEGELTPELQESLESVRPLGREMYFIMLLYALVAAINQWRRAGKIDASFYIVMLFYLGTALLHMILETQVRYHYNMLPFLMLIAAQTISGWRKREDEGRAEPMPDAAMLDTPSPEAALPDSVKQPDP
jgi:hypothetical protein